MAGQEYQVPDLASVLKTLASFAPPTTQSTSLPAPQLQPQQYPLLPSLRSEQAITGTGPKVIDPATITDWSSGLRCVMKTVAAHENIITEIRRMIKVQHEHEAQWWAGRQDLLRRQATRKESQKKLDEVLKAVGGVVAERPAGQDDLAEELRVFDAKVYRAQVQMVKEMGTKLKGFGVPFFGTKAELVKKKEEETDSEGKSKGGDERIEEAKLVELQRRIIVILEDLCES